MSAGSEVIVVVRWPRWWLRAGGVADDWWSDYRGLSWSARRGVRRRVWAGHAETDPKLLPVALGYAEWVAGPRAFRLRVLTWILLTLAPPAVWVVLWYSTGMVVISVLYLVVLVSMRVMRERRRTGRAQDAAIFDRSTMRRLDVDRAGPR